MPPKPTKADLLHEPVPVNPPARPPPFGTFDDLKDDELYYHRSREDDVDQALRNAEYRHAKAVYEGERKDGDGQVRVADDGFGSFVKFRSLHVYGAPSKHTGIEARESHEQRLRNRRNNAGSRAYPGPVGRTKPPPSIKHIPEQDQCVSPNMHSILHVPPRTHGVKKVEEPEPRRPTPPHDMRRTIPPYGEMFREAFYLKGSNHDAYGHERFSHDTHRRTFAHYDRVTRTTQPRRRDLKFGANTWNKLKGLG